MIELDQKLLFQELTILTRLDWPCPGPTDWCAWCGSRFTQRRMPLKTRVYRIKRYDSVDLS